MYLEAAEGGKKITATATCQTTLHFLATRLLALSLLPFTATFAFL